MRRWRHHEMGISTTRDYDVEREAVAAREYWARPETQPLSYKSPSHYAEAIATFIAATGVSSVLEFGCGGGRNLKQIRDVFAARGLSALALRGVDINESSIA